MTDFIFETPPKIVCEDGASARLGEIVSGLGGRRTLLISDKGLAAAGLLDEAVESFARAKAAVFVFTDVFADPPEAAVEQAVAYARANEIDAVVGFGGGSSLDTAKLVACMVNDPRPLSALYGFDQITSPRLPLVQAPTTSGTGSEVTPVAIVTTPTNEKKGVISRRLLPDIALLDASLTLGLSPRLTAMTGVDAMVHAIEAFTSRLKKNPVSDALALRALSLLTGAIRSAVFDGSDLAARRAMLQGAMMAGLAFANAPVAAVHALAYPLGGRFHVPHGLSNALMLTPVLRFNLEMAEDLYAELGSVLPPSLVESRLKGGERFVQAITALVESMPLERRLRDVGVASSDIEGLADDAMNVQRLLVNNPRPVTRADAVALYASVL